MIDIDSSVIGPWVCYRTGGTWSPADAVAMGWRTNGVLTAGVIVDHWNGASCAMHVAIEAPVTKEFTKFCFAYVFNQLGAKKILGLVGSKNLKALRFDKHLGFKEEYRIHAGHPDGDLVILSMTPAQCRWLKEKDHGVEKLATASA